MGCCPRQDDRNTCLKKACDFLHEQYNLSSDQCLSICKVALKYNVNQPALSQRFNGLTQNPCLAHESQQYLSHVQEKILIKWIKDLSLQSQPLLKCTLRRTVEQINRGCIQPGKGWTSHFLKWHPEIKLHKVTKLDTKQGQAFNKATVQQHYSLLEKVLVELDIPWENVWNMDEKECQCGGGDGLHEKVFIVWTQRNALLRHSRLQSVVCYISVGRLGNLHLFVTSDVLLNTNGYIFWSI